MGCFHSAPTADSGLDGAEGRLAGPRGGSGYDDIAAAGKGPTRSPPSYKFAVEGSGLSVQSRVGSRSSRAAIRVNKSFLSADLTALMDEQGNVSALVSRQLSMMSHYSVRSESGSVVITPEDADVPGFKLLRLIGRGGFGKVYLAEWAGQGRVAVKVMAGDPAAVEAAEGSEDADWEQRREQMAQMEAILMSVIHHPNIVKTHKVTCSGGVPLVDPEAAAAAAAAGANAGALASASSTPSAARRRSHGSNCSMAQMAPQPFQWHIIMEYCDRGSLSRTLAANRLHEAVDNVRVKWDCWAALEILKEVAQALMFLHDNRIVHGDLKAANVLLAHSVMDRRGYSAKVADFGMSRVMAVGRNTIHTQTFGTVTHMPPELLSGGMLTSSADIFSMGVLMWEIYTAERVFPKLSDTDVILAVVTKRVRPPWPLDTPIGYRKLAERCWAEVAEARPSLDEVYNEVEDLQASMCPRGQASSRPIIYSSAAATARQFRPTADTAAAPTGPPLTVMIAPNGTVVPVTGGGGAVLPAAPTSPAPALPAQTSPRGANASPRSGNSTSSASSIVTTIRAPSTPALAMPASSMMRSASGETYEAASQGSSPHTAVGSARGARSPLGLSSSQAPGAHSSTSMGGSNGGQCSPRLVQV